MAKSEESKKYSLAAYRACYLKVQTLTDEVTTYKRALDEIVRLESHRLLGVGSSDTGDLIRVIAHNALSKFYGK